MGFLLRCNFDCQKLPGFLSEYYIEALKASKLCFSHNVSPHKLPIWNNGCILYKNKSHCIGNWANNILFM